MTLLANILALIVCVILVFYFFTKITYADEESPATIMDLVFLCIFAICLGLNLGIIIMDTNNLIVI